MREVELIDKRKVNEKHFLREDGTILAKIYSSNVHYLKDGKLEDIDNTLIKRDNCYMNQENDYRVFFKEMGKESLVRMERKDNYLDIKLKQPNDSKLKKQKKFSQYVESVSYNDILNGVDIEYQALPTKVKETIILKNKETKILKFEVDTNLSLELKNGSIIAKDKEDRIFTIEKPYMEDSNGVVNENIFYQIYNNNGIYELELLLDSDWLDAKDRVYPVYIDPTISDDKSMTGIMDTYIYPGDTNVVRYNQPILKAGVERVDGKDVINRTLVKFNLPTIGTGSEVIQATLTLCGYLLEDITNAIPNQKVHIHRILTPWTEETANWENMNSNYDQRVDAIQFVNRSFIENGTIYPQYTSNSYGDITDLVKHWYRDMPNHGILIKAEKEEYVDSAYPAFYSKNHTITNANPEPVLTIAYRNQSGLESYYDYQSQAFTDGSTSINTYNGNLVGVFELASTIGSQLPVTLSLVYNTNDVIVKNNGFKFNLLQTIKEVSIDNNKYYEYVDGDGTTHYFKNQKYRVLKPGKTEPTIDDLLNPNYNPDHWYETREYCGDEDGLMLKLEQKENTFVILDKRNNRMIFSKNNIADEFYYLKEFVDVSNHKIQVNYNLNNQIVKVIDSHNQEINIDYSVNNRIQIASPSSETVLEVIDHKVNYITTQNGTTMFNYNSKNIISSIIDTTGTKMVYEYYDEIPYRVKKVIHYGLNNALGESLTFKYGFNETSIVDNKNRANLILFNSSGNKISSNTLGSEDDLNHAYSTFNAISENTDNYYYEKNKPLHSTPTFKYIKNYIENSSFEADAYLFQNAGDIETSFSTDYSVSGSRSLKVVSKEDQSLIGRGVLNPEGGSYYTLSGYFKNDKPFKLQLFYYGDHGIIETSKIIEKSDDFQRHDLTLYYGLEAASIIAFRMFFEKDSIVYIDDLQLEEGEVANEYNIVENSDFSDGFSDWVLDPIDASKTDTYKVVWFNNNKNTALQINLNNSRSISKKIPLHGKAGDQYDISFWLKNEGIFSDGSSVINSVNISYEPVDVNQQQYPIVNDSFIPNKRWQLLSYKSQAPFDYKSITISFNHINEVNQMWLTNIFFYKDLNTTYYDYDTYGNLICTNDTQNARNTFAYDKNNQLISATAPRGNQFRYEYDDVVTDRILSAISPTGISNQIKYDSFGNPITTKISKKLADGLPIGFQPIVGAYLPANINLIPGTYKIRGRGTENYLKAEYGKVLFKKNSCSNTLWKLEMEGDYFKISDSIFPTYSLSYFKNMLTINDRNSNNLYTLKENKNGSYYIKVANEDKYLKASNSSVVVTNFIVDDPTFEFYFELPEEKFIETTATYSEDGRFVTSITDSNLNKTVYDTDPVTGLRKSITNAKGQTTNYTYNEKKQITSVTQGEKIVNYTYNDKDLLEKIKQGQKEYRFTYDDFLNPKTVSIGDDVTLVTNDYEENNGNLIKTTYGNNHEIAFKYDEFDRKEIVHQMDKEYHYKYDSNGNVAKIFEVVSDTTADDDPSYSSVTKYYYDSAKRIKDYQKGDFKIQYAYDKNNNVISKKYSLNGISHNLKNSFTKDDQVVKVIIDDGSVNYEYDELSRLKNKTINDNYKTEYEYVSKGRRTSELVKSVKNGSNKYSYQYDPLNNITHVYYNDELQKQYYYDEYNELIKEEDLKKDEKIEYTYDNSGNLLTKITKNLETDVIIDSDSYEYSNNKWEDQLTKFNDQVITYDAIGNPLSIGNTTQFNWINGRSLYSYADIEKNLSIRYKYNKDGIREEKNVNGVATKYYLENNNIIYEQRGNNEIYYLYDLTGLVGFKYGGEVYYYVKNLQGDIIGILDKDYNEIVTYEYDSWGKLLSIKDNLGNEITDETNIGIINPFRYRGYYYDTETGLYYLNSRYYNPRWGRFLNADGIIGANEDILSYNLYAYVSSNPIIFDDGSGYGISFKSVVDTVANLFNNTVGRIISLNAVSSRTDSFGTRDLNSSMRVSGGVKTSVSKTIIGRSDSLIKINIGSSYGVEVSGAGKVNLDVTDESISFNATLYDFGRRMTNFSFGYDGRTFMEVSRGVNVDDNTGVLTYGKLSVSNAAMGLTVVAVAIRPVFAATNGISTVIRIIKDTIIAVASSS